MIRQIAKINMNTTQDSRTWISLFLDGVFEPEEIPKLCVVKKKTSAEEKKAIDPKIMAHARGKSSQKEAALSVLACATFFNIACIRNTHKIFYFSQQMSFESGMEREIRWRRPTQR